MWREDRNAAARVRLRAAALPPPVLIHALGRRAAPALASRAVASYWRHHPIRADRLARALAALGPVPEGWSWRLSAAADDGRPRRFRTPPAPFREAAHAAGPGACRICGQPVYRLGWHRDLWGDGRPSRRGRWHACCVAAWALWAAPGGQARILARLQRRRCAETGDRLDRRPEVDHRVPLHRVWRDHRREPWPAVLRFWGFPNLRAVNRDAHARKSAAEAAERSGAQAGAPACAPARGRV